MKKYSLLFLVLLGIHVLFPSEAGIPVGISSLSIAHVQLLHLPGEPFVQYQLAAQQMYPGRFICVAGYGDCGMRERVTSFAMRASVLAVTIMSGGGLMKRLVFSLLILGCCFASSRVDAQRSESPRTWKDITGQFTIQATYKSASDGNVVLLRENNEQTTIPLEGLSLADQQYVKNPAVPNNLKCVDLSDMKGDLPLVAARTTQILRRSESWEYSTWTVDARKDDTVGYPSVVRNDRGKNADGKYYLYFSHHDPTSGIGCAIGDKIDGPYQKLKQIDSSREHSMVLVNPHAPGKKGDPSHYSSPSVVWNEEEKLWFMYFHYYNHFHSAWEKDPDYPGGGNQMTALATTPDLSSHEWTVIKDKTIGHVSVHDILPVMPTTKAEWMYGTSSYHSIQRLPTGEWLAFMRGTDNSGTCSVGFARSKDGRKWDFFPQNPRLRPKTGADAALGIYRPGFIGYLGVDSAGKQRYLVVWAESRKGADVPRVHYGYTNDFVTITRDPRGFAKWSGGDGLISPWREGDKLYLFASKNLHVLKIPGAFR